MGTGLLKDAYDPWEGPSRSEDDDGELTGPSLYAVPLVSLLVLMSLGMDGPLRQATLIFTASFDYLYHSTWLVWVFPLERHWAFLSPQKLCIATFLVVPSVTTYSGHSPLGASVLCI